MLQTFRQDRPKRLLICNAIYILASINFSAKHQLGSDTCIQLFKLSSVLCEGYAQIHFRFRNTLLGIQQIPYQQFDGPAAAHRLSSTNISILHYVCTKEITFQGVEMLQHLLQHFAMSRTVQTALFDSLPEVEGIYVMVMVSVCEYLCVGAVCVCDFCW